MENIGKQFTLEKKSGTGSSIRISTYQKKSFFAQNTFKLEQVDSSGNTTFSKEFKNLGVNPKPLIDFINKYTGEANLDQTKLLALTEHIIDFTLARVPDEEQDKGFAKLRETESKEKPFTVPLPRGNHGENARPVYTDFKKLAAGIRKANRIAQKKSAMELELDAVQKRLLRKQEKQKLREQKEIEARDFSPIIKFGMDNVDEMEGVIQATHKNGQNFYWLRNATKKRKLLGVTKQLQQALGIRYDLPKSFNNPYGYNSKGGYSDNLDAMERGSRIHAYLEKAIKSGGNVEVNQAELPFAMKVSRQDKDTFSKSDLLQAKGEINRAVDEMTKAQEVVEYIREKYPSGDGWKTFSEYKVSDFRAYASSVDILLVNDRKKELVIIDLKTGSENIPYVTAQTSTYASFIQNHDKKFAGYSIKLGTIGFDKKTGLIQPKNLERWSDSTVQRMLYPTKDNSKVGFFFKQDTPTKKIIAQDFVYSEHPAVLPFAQERFNGIFQPKSKVKSEGDVIFFDLETMPLKNNRVTIRSASLLSMTQYRDKDGMIGFAYGRRAMYEKAFLSTEPVNSTTELTPYQMEALSTHHLTDAAVIDFEKQYGRTAGIATSKDILKLLKKMEHKTVIGHNILTYDFGVLYFSGIERAVEEGGEEASKKFIEEFNKSLKHINIIDTYDLALIVRENHEKILPKISNAELLRFFNPETYARLNNMLHQSSADVVATAKNFESLLTVMSQAERTVLFKLIKDAKNNRFGYTAFRGTQTWQKGSNALADFRFELNRSNPYLFGNPWNLWASETKPLIKEHYEDKLIDRKKVLEEQLSARNKYEVYLKRETLGGEDRLIFDMPLYNMAGEAEAQLYVADQKKDGFFKYDFDTLAGYYTDRQIRDKMIISDIGDFKMATNKIVDEEYTSFAQQLMEKSQGMMASSITAALTQAGKGKKLIEVVGNLAKNISEDEAVAMLADVKGLKSLANNDDKIYEALVNAIMLRAKLTPDNIMTKLRGLASSGMFADGQKYFDPSYSLKLPKTGQQEYLRKLSSRINSYKAMHTQFSKMFEGFDEYAKEQGLAEKLIFGRTKEENFQKAFWSTAMTGSSIGFGKLGTSEKDVAIALLKSSLPSTLQRDLIETGFIPAVVKSGKTGDVLSTFLRNEVKAFSNFAEGLGVKGENLSEYQKRILGMFLGGDVDFNAATSLAKEHAALQEKIDADTVIPATKTDEYIRERNAALVQEAAEAGRVAPILGAYYDSLTFSHDPSYRDNIRRYKFGATNASDEYLFRERAKPEVSFWSGLSVKNANEEAITKRLEENSLRKQSAQKFIDTHIMMPGDEDRLLKATKSQQKYADTLADVTERTDKLNRVLNTTVGTLSHIPLYNPDQLFGAGYHQVMSVHKSLNGLIPSFLNTSVTKMLMGGVQDYELGWQKWKYGLKSATPALSLIGGTLGAVAGAPFGASMQMGAMGASALGGLGAWASQIVGNRYERAINETGLFFSSRFNKMGALLTPAIYALNLFTKALKIASVPLLAGVGLGLYHYRRALSNMNNVATPLNNLTGISYGNGYQALTREDYMLGMRSGTTNNIIEGIEFAKRGLFTLGEYDKGKLISAAMLDVFNEAFIPNKAGGLANFRTLESKLYSGYKKAEAAGNGERYMYLINKYNPELAKELQARTDMDRFMSTSPRAAKYRNWVYNDITYDQSNEFKAIRGIQNSFSDSIKNSFMKIAAGLYHWKGFDFMNAFVDTVGSASNYFIKGDNASITKGLNIIGAGINRFLTNLGETWEKIKDKLNIKGFGETILDWVKLIGLKVVRQILKLGDLALTGIEKIQTPLKTLFLMAYEQFKKLFDFVGQIRLNIDWEKLKNNEPGAIQFKVGYDPGGMADLRVADSSGYVKTGKRYHARMKGNLGYTPAEKEILEAFGVQVKGTVFQGSSGFVTTDTPSEYQKYETVKKFFEANEIPLTHDNLVKVLKNRSGLNYKFFDAPYERAVLEELAETLKIEKASDVFDKMFANMGKEVTRYFKDGEGVFTKGHNLISEGIAKIDVQITNAEGKVLGKRTINAEDLLPSAQMKEVINVDYFEVAQ